MGHLYFTRHGQTLWNIENKICGATDIALTEKGFEQARKLGQKIKAEGLAIDEIICSPLRRAADTARTIADVTGISCREDARLTEQCFGRYEGTPRDGAEFKMAKTCFATSYSGGESMLHLAHRIYGVLDQICSQEDKVYLIVAHNGISRIIQSYFFDMGNEQFAAFGIHNCQILKYDYHVPEMNAPLTTMQGGRDRKVSLDYHE